MKRILLLTFLLTNQCVFSQKTVKSDIVKISTDLLQSLSPELKSQALFEFESAERFRWFYTPVPRKGLDFRKLNEKQQATAMQLLKASLSERGMQDALAIMQLEAVLHVLEKRPAGSDHRDPQKYYFSFFGEPSANNPWGWRIEGHHLSLNYSSVDGKINSATPLFFGTNPARVPADMPIAEGTEVLKAETAMGFDFLKSLQESQKTKAIINTKAPYDMVTENKKKAEINQSEGLSYSELSESQKTALLKMVAYYVKRSPAGFSEELMQKIEKAGLDQLKFVWMGGDHWGEGHYYRINNPAVIIEYDCTQNGANHVHSVVREPSNDWGFDAIAEHIKADH